jgi:hypothetical protein
MKLLFYSFSFLAIITSCNLETKKDKYSEYVTGKSDKDTVTSEMMKNNDFDNSIFLNEITLKDGQKSKAGLSFIMEIDQLKFLVSAKHLLGQDGGFKDSVQTNNVSEILSKWNLSNLSGADTFSVNTNDITKSDDDVLIFNTINNAKGLRLNSFKLTKMILPTAMDGKLDLKNSPKQFYLIGYTESGKEIQYGLTLAGRFNNYLVFTKDKEFNYQGLSGGPVIDNKGNVFGILTGGTRDTKLNLDLIVVSRIRPRDLK